MSKINIERSHSLGVEAAREKVVEVEKKLQERYGLKTTWKGDTIHIDGKGVSGTLEVGESSVRLNLKLGLALRVFAGKIKDSVERAFDRALS